MIAQLATGMQDHAATQPKGKKPSRRPILSDSDHDEMLLDMNSSLSEHQSRSSGSSIAVRRRPKRQIAALSDESLYECEEKQEKAAGPAQKSPNNNKRLALGKRQPSDEASKSSDIDLGQRKRKLDSKLDEEKHNKGSKHLVNKPGTGPGKSAEDLNKKPTKAKVPTPDHHIFDPDSLKPTQPSELAKWAWNQALDSVKSKGIQSSGKVDPGAVRGQSGVYKKVPVSPSRPHLQLIIPKEIENRKSFSSRFQVLDHLGEGGSCVVRKVACRTNGRICAVKSCKNNDQVSKNSIKKESRILRLLEHPNIIKTYGIFESVNNVDHSDERPTSWRSSSKVKHSASTAKEKDRSTNSRPER